MMEYNMKKKNISIRNAIELEYEKKYIKVLNAANYKNGWEYKTGLNDLRNLIGVDGKPFYCYFTDIKHVFWYLDYGPCFRFVYIPDSKEVIEELDYINLRYNISIPCWKSRLVQLSVVGLWRIDNIKYLIEEGADISANNFGIVQWALEHDFEIFYFLQDYICNLSEELWTNIVRDLEFRGFL